MPSVVSSHVFDSSRNYVDLHNLHWICQTCALKMQNRNEHARMRSLQRSAVQISKLDFGWGATIARHLHSGDSTDEFNAARHANPTFAAILMFDHFHLFSDGHRGLLSQSLLDISALGGPHQQRRRRQSPCLCGWLLLVCPFGWPANSTVATANSDPQMPISARMMRLFVGPSDGLLI